VREISVVFGDFLLKAYVAVSERERKVANCSEIHVRALISD